MKLYQPSTIRDIKTKYDFRLSKNLGQNFLTDRNIIEKIIEGAGIGVEDLVIEIGPGIGVITKEAALRAKRVVAIEVDTRLIPILEETLSENPNVSVINADVLKTDINEIIRAERENGNLGEDGRVRIIGNLPYYITTPIIMKLLEDGIGADSVTIMMQKEVADRIKATPGSKEYGALSIAVQYYCKVKEVVEVPKTVFVPQPKVDSTVLNLEILKNKPIELNDEGLFFSLVKAGFNQRRKTLLNSLSSSGVCEKQVLSEALEKVGIDSGRRAETLSMEEFAKIANEIGRKA